MAGRLITWITLIAWVATAPKAQAQSVAPDLRGTAADAANRERLDEWRRTVNQRAALLGMRAEPAWIEPVEGETPCVQIDGVMLVPADNSLAGFHSKAATPLSGITKALGQFEGACLGLRSIEALRANLEARLVAQGYITSTLTVPAQDLGTGHLRLALTLGRVAGWHIEVAAGAGRSAAQAGPGPAANAVALQPGSVLNLRDIEQALENLGRLPSQAAQFRIEPGREPGTSQVVILPAGGPRWRGSLAVESTDSADYGPVQYTVNLGWDAPLGWSDQLGLIVSLSRASAEDEHPQQSTALLSYSVPLGTHLFSAQWSRSGHRRAIQGGVSRFTEQGSDQQLQLRWQWTVWRSGTARGSVWAAASQRHARTLLDDTELLLRRRDSHSLEAGASLWMRHACGDQSLEAEGGRLLRLARYADFQTAPARLPSTWRAQWQWDCALGVGPANAGATATAAAWHLSGRLWVQGVRHPAGGLDLVTLGSRWTVRGQDPSASLTGHAALVARHELMAPPIALGARGAVRWFAGLDHGRIRQAPDQGQTTHHLTGAALGARWAWAQATGELVAARSLNRTPSGIPAPGITWQGSVAVQF